MPCFRTRVFYRSLFAQNVQLYNEFSILILGFKAVGMTFLTGRLSTGLAARLKGVTPRLLVLALSSEETGRLRISLLSIFSFALPLSEYS